MSLCDLCGQTKRSYGLIMRLPCEECGRRICAKHSVRLGDRDICTRCLRAKPPEDRRSALRASL